MIEVYADFSGQGKNYAHFPDRQSYRISLDDLRDEAVQARLRAIWNDPLSLDPMRISAEVTRWSRPALPAREKLKGRKDISCRGEVRRRGNVSSDGGCGHGWRLVQPATRLSEVNFWSPSPRPFRALEPGELFLFKLHSPINLIVGGGIFAYSTIMPLTFAWEAFGTAIGVTSLEEMRRRILRYRNSGEALTGPIEIGCRIVTQPFFLPESRWFAPPSSWARNIVSFKVFSTENADGKALWSRVEEAMREASASTNFSSKPEARYGEPTLIRPRLGQGAFRLVVTDLYARRCAVTRERTLPALEAAHIKPFAEGGDHTATNGILLRRDLHSLFDQGYVTVTPDLRFEVSRRIREEFENGRHYYQLHGQKVSVPSIGAHRPDEDVLRWHNEHRFLG